MSLAALLGYGKTEFTSILSTNVKIQPENLIIIGARSFAESEHQLLKQLGVKIYYIEDVNDLGLKRVLEESVNFFAERQIKYGVSFDLDVLDNTIIKSVGTSVKGGIGRKESLPSLSIFEGYSLVAFEIVDYNPSLDTSSEGINFINEMLIKIHRIGCPLSSVRD